jgi:hypothetical protein
MQYVSIATSRSGWQPDPPAAELKGKALDDALDQAGLPKSGTADEKRAALAAHEASTDVNAPSPETSVDPAAINTNPDDGLSVSKHEED